MEFEEELKLSFYKEIAAVNARHGVVLVQHTETGKVYVKKTLDHYDRSVFEFIRAGRFTGVPVIKELFESDGSLIVIEDYISGHSLDELLESKLFSKEETIRIITELCNILEPFHTHEPQIVHRDIKDSNVIIDNEGKVYLIDFDASRIVIQGRNRDTDLIGTEEYAAPEQYGFGQSDQRTDIYAMGILMNRLLTGEYPSEKKYKGELSNVIVKATSLDPKDRYQDVQSLKMALQSVEINVEYSTDIDDENISPDSNDFLRVLLSHLPYPIRELPGFRSGRPLFFVMALLGYALLIAFGFFATTNNPEYTPAQNRFYDIATFVLVLVPTLYVGNYLGIRDRLPWRKTQSKGLEILRIGVGCAASVLLVIIVVTIAAMIFKM